VAPRFLIDENLSPLLARHLRTAHGFDAVHVQELGLRGASDADILARAITAGPGRPRYCGPLTAQPAEWRALRRRGSHCIVWLSG
jgi:hypothetical protein